MYDPSASSYRFTKEKVDQTLQNYLSQILNQVTKIITALQNISILKLKGQDHSMNQAIVTLEQRLFNSLIHQNIQHSQLNEIYKALKPSAMILKRFRCRLIEIIVVCRQRFKNIGNSQNLEQTMVKIERLIYLSQEGEELHLFLKKLFAIFINHLVQQKEKQAKSPEKNKGEENFCLNVRKTKSFFLQTDQHKKMKKTVNDLNQRFKTLSCLDLDYPCFRSSFFQAKNNKDQLYQQCIERNKTINNLISIYSKDFKEFRKRKDKKRFEKKNQLQNFRKQTQTDQNYTSLIKKKSFLEKSIDRNRRFKYSLKMNDKVMTNNSETQSPQKKSKPKKLSFGEAKIQFLFEDQSPKREEVQMNNVLICPNRFVLAPAKAQSKHPLKYLSENFKKKNKKQQKVLINNLPEISFVNKY